MNKTLVIIYSFAKQDIFTGSHLLSLHIAQLKAIGVNSPTILLKGRRIWQRELIKKHLPEARIVYQIDQLRGCEFNDVIFTGTGVFSSITKTYEKVRLSEAIKKVEKIKDSKFNYIGKNATWYYDVFKFVEVLKVPLSTIVIDPLLDLKIGMCMNIVPFEDMHHINIKHAYWKVFEENHQISKEKVTEHFTAFGQPNMSPKRMKSMELLENFDNAYTGEQFFCSSKFLQNVAGAKFTFFTYGYDERTVTTMRVLDALAFDTIPISMASYEDLITMVGREFADYYKRNNLIITDKDYKLPEYDIKHINEIKAII